MPRSEYAPRGSSRQHRVRAPSGLVRLPRRLSGHVDRQPERDEYCLGGTAGASQKSPGLSSQGPYHQRGSRRISGSATVFPLVERGIRILVTVRLETAEAEEGQSEAVALDRHRPFLLGGVCRLPSVAVESRSALSFPSPPDRQPARLVREPIERPYAPAIYRPQLVAH